MESTQTRRSTGLRILLTGANGQVGWELQRSLARLGEIVACDRASLDLSNPSAIKEKVLSIRPDLIVNAAAYTAVDRAEFEPELAIAINQTAPKILAESASQIGASLIHYSTDYVFDGTSDRPYKEDDSTNPLGIYGQTKLAGEQAISTVGIPYLIFRTSWVYGSRGKNFMLTMLRLAREKSELRVVADQIGAPTWSRTIAETTRGIIEKIYQKINRGNEIESSFAESLKTVRGIYHLTSSGFTSWYGFAQAIFALDPKAEEQVLKNLIAIATSDYPTPAQRPANSRLDLTKIGQTFDLDLPSWESALKQAIR
jgi:dTDP-4-dehydrorhamnose reductase